MYNMSASFAGEHVCKDGITTPMAKLSEILVENQIKTSKSQESKSRLLSVGRRR